MLVTAPCTHSRSGGPTPIVTYAMLMLPFCAYRIRSAIAAIVNPSLSFHRPVKGNAYVDAKLAFGRGRRG